MTLLFNSKDTRMQGIISKCASLHETYKPPWWCFGPWMNVFVTLIKEKLAPSLRFEREIIVCEDGGEVSLDWADDDVTRNLPVDAPVIGILHTITGESNSHRGFMSYAANRGWRSCVLNRRGHSGMTLKVVPHFSVMGNVDDTVLMVDRMRKHYPNNFIGLAGISAGSGQAVSYIGREGGQVRVNAATVLCPAWDMPSWLAFLQNKYPWLDGYLTRGIQDHYLKPMRNQPALQDMQQTVEKAWTAKNLAEWMDYAAPLAGCDDLNHYYKENNPMQYFQGNEIPCLVLNALDDFLCLKENIRYDVKDQVMNYVLSITDYGSHIAYNEGSFAQGSYMERLTLDFFDAVMLENQNSN